MAETGVLGGRTPWVLRTALFGVLFVTAVALTGIGVLFALSGKDEQVSNALPVLRLNLALVFALGVFLYFRTRVILFKSEAGQSAPRLHRRFVLIFSFGALVPAILVGLFFAAFVSRNFSNVFGPSVRETMETSRGVSNAYLGDEMNEIGQGVYDIAGDLNRAESQLSNRITYTAFLINQAVFREFPLVYVIDSQGRVLAQAESPSSPGYVLPSQEVFSRAADGLVTFTSRNELDFIIALYKLENYTDAFLYTGRYVRAGVLANIDSIDEVEAAIDQYSGNFAILNRVFLLSYFEVALLIFFAAVWLALLLANRIVSPLGSLVNAAEKVRIGNLDTRIDVKGIWDEIGDLANAFNRMTRQLHSQRQDLVRGHEISEQRRIFSEAVLSGVSAGVIGLSPKGQVTVLNQSAETLLNVRERDLVGKPLQSILPAFYPIFKTAIDDIRYGAQDQINLETDVGTRNLDVRVSSYTGERSDTGWVITFDDMTRLVAAQRHSAWRDVARRIAHEIKNPLTPIQLSAERLQRKYRGKIKTDPDIFTNCTQTILRQVLNLGRMVDEFSTFARMPVPVLQLVVLEDLMQEILFAQRVAFPDIEFSYENATGKKTHILCDTRLINQALTNIYKNAGESITRRIDETGQDYQDGKIETDVSARDGTIYIDIVDNGQGWPVVDRDKLLEPYMTTRDEGSGLGLAIVKRIAEDHDGELNLFELKSGQTGVHVQLCLPEPQTAEIKTGEEVSNLEKEHNEI